MARARTVWEEGTEPGRLVAALGVAVALTAVVLEAVVLGGVGWFFDVVFVIGCGALALLVRPSDFFLVAVLPPLLMVGVFFLVALVSPGSIADASDHVVQALVAGLTKHAGALISGHALCLAVLAMRRHVLLKRRQEHRPPH